MTHHDTTADVVYHLASGRTFPVNRPEVRERYDCQSGAV